MKHFGLVGQNIAYSLSPKIHQAFFNQYAIKADYQLFDVKDDLTQTVNRLKSQNIDGFNVTTPYKREILPLLDELTQSARQIQSVNTVINRSGRWIGDNTDTLGFKESISLNHYNLKNKTTLVLGAGGAARGIIHSLIELGVRTILIYSRTRSNTNALIMSIKKQYGFNNVMSVFDTHGTVVDCIINTTPIGGPHYPDEISIDLNYVVSESFIDINYIPRRTKTMKLGESLGFKVIGGFDMLASQAVYANMLWHEMRLDKQSFDAFIESVRHECY